MSINVVVRIMRVCNYMYTIQSCRHAYTPTCDDQKSKLYIYTMCSIHLIESTMYRTVHIHMCKQFNAVTLIKQCNFTHACYTHVHRQTDTCVKSQIALHGAQNNKKQADTNKHSNKQTNKFHASTCALSD